MHKKNLQFFSKFLLKKTLETMTPVAHHANVSHEIIVSLINAAWCATGVMIFGFLVKSTYQAVMAAT